MGLLSEGASRALREDYRRGGLLIDVIPENSEARNGDQNQNPNYFDPAPLDRTRYRGAAMTRHRVANRRQNEAYIFEHDGHIYRASAGRFPSGDLAEIFLDVAKAGSTLQQTAECAAILTSLALQHGVPPETIRHAVNGPVAVALDHFIKMAVL
jgi:hypothetical protein